MTIQMTRPNVVATTSPIPAGKLPRPWASNPRL
jgi:hypothetical protein